MEDFIMDEELIYFMKNVPYSTGVRANIQDVQGFLLTGANTYYALPKSKLRDFVLANRQSIADGVIIQVEEPPLDMETPNALTDDEISSLLKSYLQLKKKLGEVTSQPLLYKFLQTAKDENKSQKTMDLITERLEEITPPSSRGVI
jgi:hypothetical protein